MKIRSKTLLIVGGVAVALILTLYGFSHIILIKGVIELERDVVINNIERVIDVLYDDINELHSINYDWSAWNDTYEFVQNINEKYIESNLVNSTFTTIRVNVMLFFDSSGELIFGKAVDLQNETEVEVPKVLLNYLYEHPDILFHHDIESNISGIIVLDKPLLISSLPILTSEDKGPIMGSLVMIRYLDNLEINRLSKITHLSLMIYNGLENSKKTFVRPINKNIIEGYTSLEDIYGNPALTLKIRMPRNIYHEGLAILHYYTISSAIAIIIIIFVMSSLLNRFVLNRLITLNDSVKRIAKSGNISRRIKMRGNDEITDLANEINTMLMSLEKSQKEIEKALENEREFKRKTAHYFFNPICIAKGYLEIAKEEKEYKFVDRALKAIERIEKVVKNIVTEGKIKE
ncbi:hypothetical protein B6U81_02550 [Thermoplasmatales archaeon ex4484_30]|nr:MAG: HAMP domain-containing protein [Thermoplasmata archaeon]OYT61637.1 MAG: hypothetical protein B6U81_02550 [Thermoplasmatales archaeon ex4484_30]